MYDFLVKKENGCLMWNDMGGYETRNPSTWWCIVEADKIYNWKDFDIIRVVTTDWDFQETSDYTYSKINNYDNLVPDFNFHAWPEVGIDDYSDITRRIHENGLTKYEINKVGWIGNIKTNEMRSVLLDIGNQHPDMLDIINSGDWSKKSDSIKLTSERYISTPELVKKYSILIDIEGCGYSGRLKHLMWSHRPLLLVDRPHKEYFFEYLKEWEHYIPVKRDLSDLLDKTKWCLDNYKIAQQIAENAYQFSKMYLTREACYKQWNHIITNSPGYTK